MKKQSTLQLSYTSFSAMNRIYPMDSWSRNEIEKLCEEYNLKWNQCEDFGNISGIEFENKKDYNAFLGYVKKNYR